MWIDRKAWEMRPPDGILIVKIRQPGLPIHLCISLDELETAFADVKKSRSCWEGLRHYHWPRLPRAAYSFVLEAP
jgi:hypothetical protein